MNLSKPLAAVAVSTFASLAGQPYFEEARPVVMVQQIAMPQRVPEEYLHSDNELGDAQKAPHVVAGAVGIYHLLRKEFSISHTEMSEWLGIKRRTLYNWLNKPERSIKYGPQIELRLSSLVKLHDEMEPEHYQFLHKIAFSPIYGDPRFGAAILMGASSSELITWYDELFSQFESYRTLSAGNELIG